MRNFCGFIIFILFLFNGKLFSQTDSLRKPVKQKKLCEVNLIDGSSYKGIILKQTDFLVYLKSSAGVVIHIPKNSVLGINFYKGGVASSDTIGNIHKASIAQKYYFTSTNAFLFQEKKFYGSSAYFLFYNLNYSFSKNLSMGISTFPIGAPILFNIKTNFEISPKFYFGIDVIGGTMSHFNSKTYGVGAVCKLTNGTEEGKNYTIYVGYGDLEWWVKPNRKRPGLYSNYYKRYYSPFAGLAVSIPFMHMRNTNFTAEAFVFPNVNIYTVSAGIRTYRRQKVSFVAGLQYFGNSTFKVLYSPLPFYYITMPYIGFSFRV